MLSHRLQRVLALIPYGTSCAADIGCDHGFLSRELVIRNGVKRVIAVDLSPASLAKTASLAEYHNLTDRIITREGFGLRPLGRGEAEIAVIAGMGGGEIVSILSDSLRTDGIRRFVLLPHRDAPLLRKYLSEKFCIKTDRTIKDKGKLYDIIEAQALSAADAGLTETEIYFNRSDIIDPTPEFAERLKIELHKAKEYGARATGERREYFERRIKIINGIVSP